MKSNKFFVLLHNIFGLLLHLCLGLHYNLVYGTGSTFYFGGVGSTSSNYSSLSAWNSGTSEDGNSPTSADALFTSPTTATPNLNISTSSPAVGMATPAPTITTVDYTGTTRSISTPTIGAIEVVTASATITETGTLSAFSTTYGTASAYQSFNVSGSSLTANITVTAPTGYVVSTSSGSGYSSSVTLTESGGTVTSTPIYVEIAATTPVGSPSGNITLTSTGATTINVAVTGTVSPASLTITASGQSQTYGTLLTLGTSAFTTSGLQNSETVGSVTLKVGGSTTSPATTAVGTYSIVPSSATGGTFTASNYSITYTNGTLTVNAAPLTITASGQSQTYGTLLTLGTSAFTTSGLQNSETVGSVTLKVGGSTTSPATTAVGTYSIVPSAATGGTFTASNYSITYTNGTLTVNAAPLTITASGQSQTYGTLLNLGTSSFTTSGLQNSETVGSVTLKVGGSTTSPATTAVGTYSIVPSSATGGTFTASNYSITYTNGTLTVNAAPLTITASGQSQTYGTLLSLGTSAFTTSGLQNSETVGSVTLKVGGSTTSPATTAVGTYSIVPSAATGGTFTASNYSITYTNGTLTVNAAPLTITASGQSQTYGTLLSLGTSSFTTSGLQNSETVGSVTLKVGGSTTSPATTAVGTYSIVPSAATGGTFTASNYSITYTNGTLTVNAAPLTITASGQSQTYGTLLTLGTSAFTTSGLQNSETVGSVTLKVGGSTTSPATTAVGTYSIVPSAATGGTFTASNYSITYTNGTLTVNAAPLTITANSTSKCYGQTVTFAGTEFTTSGLQNSDYVTSVTLTSSGASSGASVSGSPYNIVPSAASGGGLSNYSITYDDGVLTVNALPDASSFAPTSTDVCLGSAATITVSSSSLTSDTYNVTYGLSGANSGSGLTASMSFSAGTGTGTFVTGALSYAGSTTLTVTSIEGSLGCSSSISSGNTTTFTVLSSTTMQWLGLVNSDWNTAGNWCPALPDSTDDVEIPSTAQTQPYINGTGTGTGVHGNGYAYVHSLTIERGAALTLSPGGHLAMYGSPDIQGTYTQNAGVLELAGGGAQTLPALVADSVLMQRRNTSSLTGNLTVVHSLNLVQGIIVAGIEDSIVDVYDTLITAVTSGTNSSWIDGTLRRAVGDTGNYQFPLGDAVNWQYANINLLNNNLGASGGIDSLIGFFNDMSANAGCTGLPGASGYPSINGTEINNFLNGGFWTIHPDVSSYSSISYNATLGERGYTNGPSDVTQVGVIKRAGCPDDWQALGIHNNNNTLYDSNYGTITAVDSLLTAFSDFGEGFGGDPLPVSILYVEAEPVNNSYIEVLWATALEINNHGFEVQRSTDAENWPDIGFVEGHGNTTSENDYTYNDMTVVPNVQYYYRLKQIDNNGNYTYTDIVTATITSTTSFTVMDFRPNPAYNSTYLYVNSSLNQEITVDIYDMIGQRVMAKQVQLITGENGPIEFDFGGLASGTYSARVSSASEVYVKKLVVTK